MAQEWHYVLMDKGKLIVIEGSDGAGKGTQLELLVEYCQNHSLPYAVFDFPQYEKTFFGSMCGKFLSGEYGSADQISSYLISLPYAADRWKAKPAIEAALSEGKLVFINRYAPSNAVYQASKLPPEKREEFIRWEFELEYQEFAIPKEDMVVYLHVPVEISQQLIDQKEKRSYLNGKKKDQYEENIALLRTTEELYDSFCKKYDHWFCIECVEKESILSKDQINAQIINELKKRGVMV